MDNLKNTLYEIYEQVKEISGGKVADYIPQLADVNPDLFGISICDIKGEIIEIGDTNISFCMQSCSKPLSYCLAHDLYGRDELHKYVGYEPSGREFNAHVLNKQGLPHNPMINAGAIMVDSLLERGKEPSHRFNLIKDYYSKLSGHIGTIGFDNSVFLSEKRHANRNISLSYYMRENKAFGEVTPSEISDSLDLYFQQCSTTVTCKMGAVIAATLANAGICPITKEEVVTTEAVQDCLTIMYGCGMYDYSGQFSFEVGLPAKSGVSGCIMLVIPDKMGICIWSPPLDDNGNSFKGIKVCKLISKKLKAHMFRNIVMRKIEENEKLNLENKFITLCANNDIKGVSMLIDQIDVNKSDYDKRTPLHLAASEGNLEIVELLIQHGAQLTKDRWGNTAYSEVLNNKSDKFNKIREYLEMNNLTKSDDGSNI